MRKFFVVMLAALLAPTVLGLALTAGSVMEARAQAARQASATLKVTCMSDGSMRIDSDASTAPR